MTSAGHRMLPGRRRLAFAYIGRAPDVFGLKFKSHDFNGDRPGIVRCLKSAKNFENLFHISNKSADARPGTGRCFMSPTATSEQRRVFA